MEPGKILHELRTRRADPARAEAAQPVLRERRRDAPLADPAVRVLALDRRRQAVGSLRDNALAALAWIDQYGDRDGDGYVEYETRSSQGLGNQCWRDSCDGVQFADGTIPYLPIATAEIQGYVYDAKLRLAELADGPLADAALATRLRSEAEALRERFDRDFWIDERGGYYAIGLDGDKRPIDSLTSNIGQLLWSGHRARGARRDRRRAAHVRSRCSRAGACGRCRPTTPASTRSATTGARSGRTTTRSSPSASRGTASATRRTGSRWRCSRRRRSRATGCRRRSPATRGRSAAFPVPYPTACSPQAWATGAPFLLVRAMLGLEARDGQVTLDPALPDEIGRVSISGLRAFGTHWDVEANGRSGHVRLAHEG